MGFPLFFLFIFTLHHAPPYFQLFFGNSFHMCLLSFLFGLRGKEAILSSEWQWYAVVWADRWESGCIVYSFELSNEVLLFLQTANWVEVGYKTIRTSGGQVMYTKEDLPHAREQVWFNPISFTYWTVRKYPRALPLLALRCMIPVPPFQIPQFWVSSSPLFRSSIEVYQLSH